MKEEKKEPLPEFTWLQETVLQAQACTSLGDAEAELRCPPSGTRHGWRVTDNPREAPVPCADAPDTHRHIIFDC